MVSSPLDIANMALGNIGQGAIQSFNGPAASQRLTKQRYDEARIEALSATLWNFASLWRVGNPVAIDPKPHWQYVFVYPADALKVFEILKASGETTEIPFEVTARPDVAGKLIHCNQPSPTFVYTKDTTDLASFTPEFTTALSWLLASKIAMGITKSIKIQQEAYKMWIGLSSTAVAASANEGSTDADVMAGYQEAR